MKLYFSGISSKWEASVLAKAGIDSEYMLADPHDWHNIPHQDYVCSALDSGTYRHWKAGNPLSVDDWWNATYDCLCNRKVGMGADFIVMPDVFGDPAATLERWRELCGGYDPYKIHWENRLTPVWQWGANEEDLLEMMNPPFSRSLSGEPIPRLVAVGGCVPWMRDKDEQQLERLVDIAKRYGKHLHVLGLNWLEAMEALDQYLQSCDTSKFLDGARYGTFLAVRDRHLIAEHKRYCPEGEDREALCVESARALHRFVNKCKRQDSGQPVVPQGDFAKSVRYTLRPRESRTYSGTVKTGPSLALMHVARQQELRREEAKEEYIDWVKSRRK